LEADLHIERQALQKKAQLFGILEQLCEQVEPSQTQEERARTSYEAVGQWLASASNPLLSGSSIYLQGSTALGTTVKPIGSNEHDVDLVHHLLGLGRWIEPARAKALVGDRLKESERYRAILEEKQRCWRLNYAGEFHLDITPSISNKLCARGGELVPDRQLRCWKATNPKGYRDAFKRRAELVPQMRLLKSFAADSARADIEPFPKRPRFKGLLCRIVQIAKRHRDVYFLERDVALAPISVIVTTLAAWSYERAVASNVFDSELDVLRTVIAGMPDFIQRPVVGGRLTWAIWNETTAGENFAERWNAEPARARAFFEWHAAVMADLDELGRSAGLDELTGLLGKSFGQQPAAQVMQDLYDGMAAARRSGCLSLAPGLGLTTTSVSRATRVPPNTFYGTR
jgi:hypothetical protein